MYVKIHSDKKDKNKGSCSYLVDYLEKENIEKDILSQEQFFNQDRSDIDPLTVRSTIDANKAKLTAKESKFYMISVNPSKAELKHICKRITGRDIKDISGLTKSELAKYEEALKNYSRSVMDEYAKNFNRGLNGKDLLYYGKVEHNRYYARDCQEVREGLKKAGELKEGFQSHVHIIVSRKDITNKIKLSPMANARNAKNKVNGKEAQIGFDRKLFVEKCEKTFDNQFNYWRNKDLSFTFYHTMKNGMRSVAYSALRDVPLVKEYGKAERGISTATSIANAKDPLEALTAAFRQVPAAKECLKAISYAYNPSKIALDIGKKIITTALNTGL